MSNTRHNKLQSLSLPRKQQGVALIIALIITGIVVTLATQIIYRQQIQIRLSSSISTLEQNYQYAYGMEEFAGTILNRSFEDQPDFVSLNDDWYSETGLVLPITGGTMTGKLHDLHARINVNSLLREKEEIPQPPAPTATQTDSETETPEPKYFYRAIITKERLTELIRAIDEDSEMGPPENFAVILKDWIDSDQENGNPIQTDDDSGRGNGAETTYYQSLEPAYYSANTEMISPTELRLLKEMQEKFYIPITNEISTLPILTGTKPTNTAINVNTASDKVLAALGFSPDVIETIIENRKEDPYIDIEAFKSEFSSSFKNDDSDNDDLVDPLDLDVKSEYFLLEGKVEINNTRLFINSILWRKQNGQISVIMRDFSNPQTISKAVN